MNRVLKYIYVKLGWVCPSCGDLLYVWRGCSHTPSRDFCKTCDYEKIHKGVSISSISFMTIDRCTCGGLYECTMFAGETEYTCIKCGGMR